MKTSEPAGTIQSIIVFDLEGNGFTVLWTFDGRTWINVSKRPLNEVEKDRKLEYLEARLASDGRTHKFIDFYCRIPAELLNLHTRII